MNNIYTRFLDNCSSIEDYYQNLVSLTKNHKFVGSTNEWIIDNYYLVVENKNILKKAFREDKYLKILIESNIDIYKILFDIFEKYKYNIDSYTLIKELNNYQNKNGVYFSYRSIKVIPIFIPMIIIEKLRNLCDEKSLKETDISLVNKLIDKIDEDKENGQEIHIKDYITIDNFVLEHPTYLYNLYINLKEFGESSNDFLEELNEYLEANNVNLKEIINKEHLISIEDNILVSNLFNNLRTTSRIEFNELCFKISKTERILLTNHVYKNMTKESKELYRHQITLNTKKKDEYKYVKNIVEKCNENGKIIGDYIFKKKNYNRIFALYVSVIVFFTVLISFFLSPFILSNRIASFLLLLLPISEVVMELVNKVFMRFNPPKPLPKLDFSKGIPKEYSTMVVIPTIIKDTKKIDEMFEALEKYYLSNKSPNLYFSLLGDCKEADEEKLPFDDEVAEYGLKKSKELNEKYGRDMFFYLYRRRSYNQSEGKYLGYERKRGGLLHFNKLLLGTLSKEEKEKYVYCENISSIKARIKYVITLDTDTELVLNTAQKLVGIMAHPYNRPVLNKEGNKVIKGYGLIQPKVSLDIESTNKSFYSQITAGIGGFDIYSSIIPNFYQDVFDEGSFVGKGIYDVEVFEKVVGDKLPENLILSHDLLEGNYVRCGYTSDVELIDDFPSSFLVDMSRQHRWARGDVQVLPWLKRNVKTKNGKAKNPLNGVEKFKIFDNLRRMLINPIMLVTLFASFLIGNPLATTVTLFGIILLPLLFYIRQVFETKRRMSASFNYYESLSFGFNALITRLFINFITIPYMAYMHINALVKSLYRMFISHKNLLNWITAEEASKTINNKLPTYIKAFVPNYFFSLILVGTLFLNHNNIPIGILVIFSFLIAPFILWNLSKTRVVDKKLGEKEDRNLKEIALRTWKYFDTLLKEENNYLIPDNYQVNREIKEDTKTSPTDIGMSILAVISAYKLDFIAKEKALMLLENITNTLEKLEKWHGHIFNWINIRTLKKIPPYFISSVDSANLEASILVAKNFAKEQGFDNLSDRLDTLFNEMDFKILYNTKDVFSIGYDVQEDKLSVYNYNKFASESRILSFVAIAKGDAPNKHWLCLDKSLTKYKKFKGLASWSGTSFEYFMPEIFMKSYPNTLLDESYFFSVYCQKEYMKEVNPKMPWGISESAYGELDDGLNYKYKAFSTPYLKVQEDKQQEIVISPYSSILAISNYPDEVYKNINKLKKLGLYSDFGFYESFDYDDHEVVLSYFAHHQGMILSSLTNYLKKDAIRNYFHNDIRIKAVEILLKEKVQLNPIIDFKIYGYKKYNYEKEKVENDIRELSYLSSVPEVSVLSNNNYLLLINDRGNGFSRYKKIQLNRYRKITEQDYGNFMYIKDLSNGKYWSNTYAPVNKTPDKYNIVFASDRIKFYRQDESIATTTEMIVTKEHNSEIRRVTFKNHGSEDKYLEITTYTEPIIEENIDDISHRTFKNLFISSTYDSEHESIIMCRKNNSAGTTNYLFNRLLVENDEHEITYETERSNFIGRNKNTNNPQALSRKRLTNTVGTNIDPVIALRTTIIVPAGSEKIVYYISGFSKSRDEITNIIESYDTYSKIDTAFEFATLANNINTKTLNITGPDMRNYNIMLDYLYQTSRHFINPERKDILTKNALNQTNLWKFSISGDYPIILVEIHDSQELNLVKEVLKAYEFYKSREVFIDIVIVNREKDKYKAIINREIEKEIYRMNTLYDYMDTPGKIFVLDSEEVSDNETILLNMVARLRFDTRKSTSLSESIKLLQQENKMGSYDSVAYEDVIEEKVDEEDYNYYNGYGGFSKDGKEYIITNQDTPTPWTNVIANPYFGTIVTNNECGFTYAYNSQMFKITSWTNDIVLDDKSEVIKVNDKIVNATSARHGFGYSVFNHNTLDYSFSTTHFVSEKDTIKFYKINFKNKRNEKETYKITLSINPTFGPNEEKSSRYLLTDYFEKLNSILIRNVYNTNFNHITCFLTSTEKVVNYMIEKILFKSITIEINLEPNEEKEFSFMMGTEIGNDNVAKLIEKYNTNEKIDAEFNKVIDVWKDKLSVFDVKTPDQSFNIALNGWYLYQTIAARLYAKAGFYQVGGAFGFRDQLQDATNIVMVDENLTRNQILVNAAHQFKEGDVLHWWHENIRMGLRSKYKDDFLWLIYSVNKYVETSGDYKVLDEKVPFATGDALKEGENERGINYYYSEDQATVYEHCILSIEKAIEEIGDNGLPLMGGGDWNDGMNKVGIEGKGTSVWLGFFQYLLISKFIKLFKDHKEMNVKKYEEHLARLKDALNGIAWDNDYYLRAFFDNGHPLGSSLNNECKIDLISQSFSILSEVVPEEYVDQVVNSVEEFLVDRDLKIVKLLTPAFDKSRDNPGYIMDYPKGIRENGGQYTHAVSWYIMALIKLHMNDKAYEYYEMINPINRSKTKKEEDVYKVEPYVIAADIYSNNDHKARGGWTWYTGSAGWFYNIGITEILGIKKSGNTLRFEPSVPSDWTNFEVDYRYYGTLYKIKINFTDNNEIVVDGEKTKKDYITLKKDKRFHAIIVNIRRR